MYKAALYLKYVINFSFYFIPTSDIEPPSCSFCPSDIVREEIKREVRVGWERPRCSDNSGMVPSFRPNRHRFDRFKVPSSFLVQYEVSDDNGNSHIGCSFNVILKGNLNKIYLLLFEWLKDAIRPLYD